MSHPSPRGRCHWWLVSRTVEHHLEGSDFRATESLWQGGYTLRWVCTRRVLSETTGLSVAFAKLCSKRGPWSWASP